MVWRNSHHKLRYLVSFSVNYNENGWEAELFLMVEWIYWLRWEKQSSSSGQCLYELEKGGSPKQVRPEGIVLRVKTPLLHNVLVSFWEAILQVLGDYRGCQLAFGTQCVSSLSLEEDLMFLISLTKWFLLLTEAVSLFQERRRGLRITGQIYTVQHSSGLEYSQLAASQAAALHSKVQFHADSSFTSPK